MTVSNFSTTASNNTAINGVNISEGMSPSDVNNALREFAKDIRTVWNDKEWFLLGDADGATTFTRASASSVTVSSNITSAYHVGRRVKVIGSNTGTIFGKIATSSFSSPNTTLAFTFDSGSISSGDSTVAVYVGSVFTNPANPVVDEDNMASDSAVLPPSQQSTKAFVTSGSVTLSNKSIALGSNTISGTTAQFNSALSDGSFATLAGSETLTNKTLTSPTISSITNSGTLTLPSSSDTIVGRNTTDTLNNKTISLSNNTVSGTLSQFQSAVSDATLVDLSNFQTLTNKTLTSPVISSISNSGTLTLPSSTDTLVGRSTTDTLANKTITTPVINQISNTGTLSLPTSTDTLIGKATTDTLTNKTISGSANTLTNIATSSLSGTISNSQLGGSISTDKIGDSQITTAKINNDAITIDKIADAVIVTNSEQASQSGDDNTFFTTQASDSGYFRQDSSETINSGNTWSTRDSFIATTAAIDARVIDLVDDVGGFFPIANETSFPNTNPDVNNGAGTIVSIKGLSQALTANSSGVITILNGTVGNSTVTINGLSASQTLGSGFGVLVETTTTLNTYTFHREVAPATSTSSLAGVATEIGRLGTTDAIADMNLLGTTANITAMSNVSDSITNVNSVASGLTNINTVASNISGVNSFGERYRVASSAPVSSNDVGDLYFDSTSNILKVYGASGWQSAGSSVNGTSDRFKFTVSGTPTTLSGADDNSETLSYDAGFIDVYLNGVRMVNGVDVTVTSGNSLVFANALANGDIVEAVAFGTFSVASLNASNLDSGTVNNARLPSTISDKTINASTPLTVKGDGSSVEGSLVLNCHLNSHGVKIMSPPHSAGQSYTIKLPDNQIAQDKFMKVKSISGSGSTAIGQLEFADITSVGGAVGVDFNDDVKARFGASNELQIYKANGGNSYIQETGTSNLRIAGTEIFLRNSADTENLAVFRTNGANELYYDNSKKFETTSTGVDVTGTVTTDGLNVSGTSTLTGDVSVSGELNMTGTGTNILDYAGTAVSARWLNSSPVFESIFSATREGDISLYHNGSKKFETTSTGVEVSGVDDSNNLIVGNNNTNFAVYTDGTVGEIRLKAEDGSSSNFAKFMTFYTHAAGSAASERMRIDSSGNILFNTTDTTLGSTSDNGVVLTVTGEVTAARAGNVCLLNRLTSDGSLIEFRKDGSAIGTIGIDSSTITMGKTGGATFAIGGDAVVPTSSNSFDLGSTSAVWRNIYTSDFHMTNEGLDKGNDIDGTKGSWTFQEGADDLFLLNNKNGKKYKFKLEECK